MEEYDEVTIHEGRSNALPWNIQDSYSSGESEEIDARQIKRMQLVSSQTQRKVTQAEVFFLDYYLDFFRYLRERKKRLQRFKKYVKERQLADDQVEVEWRYYCGQERAFLRKRRTRVRFSEFEILLQVGEGGYGQVFLSRKRDTHELCALKKMDKSAIIKRDKVENILIERDVLMNTESPWLVKLLYSFQDPLSVYLAMEYVPGGDLRALLNNVGSMQEEPAKFYAAEMIMGMVSLHSLGYIHRDLKPENYLIDEMGHVKLTDFGLAKGNLSPEWIEEMKKRLETIKTNKPAYRSSLEKRKIYQNLRKEDRAMANSFVGTPDYMAPELLLFEGYDLLVDYWAIGCIIFEILYGFTPFTGNSPDEVFVQIKYHETSLERPEFEEEDDVTDAAWDLITRLLAPRERRIGTLKEIQDHPWFAGFDWDHLRELESPFIPELDSPEDTRYFDLDGMGDPAFSADNSLTGLKTLARKAFIGFTYRHHGWQNSAAESHVLQEVKNLAKMELVSH